MNELDKEFILVKIVRRKIRILKFYEKNFIKKGEFWYFVFWLEIIEFGNLIVCYILSYCYGLSIL